MERTETAWVVFFRKRILPLLLFPLWASGVGAENEAISLKLHDGTKITVRHVETRDDMLIGKVGALNAQFPRDRIEAFTVPAVVEALKDAEAILASLSEARFERIESLHRRIETLVRQLKGLQIRLKWLAPDVDKPIPDLEAAASRIDEVLKIVSAAENLLSDLNGLSEAIQTTEDTWQETLGRIERLLVEIPFPEKQEALRSKLQTIARKRELLLKREAAPFFAKAKAVRSETLTHEAYAEIEALSRAIEDPDLRNEATGLLDRLKLRLPTVAAVDADRKPVSDTGRSSASPTVAQTVDGADEGSRLGVLRRIDPRNLLMGVAALFLIFVVPRFFSKNKAERKARTRLNLAPEDLPIPIAVQISGPDPVQKESAPSVPFPEVTLTPSNSSEKIEEFEELVEFPDLSNELLSDVPLEIPPIEEPVDSGVAASSQFQGGEVEDLDFVLGMAPSDPEQNADREFRNGAPCIVEPPEEEFPAATPRSERGATDDLFDALERTIEARLAAGKSGDRSANPPPVETPPPITDLEEPKVSLGGVLGLEPDIGQYLDSSPEEPAFLAPTESFEIEEPTAAPELDWLNDPLTPALPVEGDFQIQIGSGYTPDATFDPSTVHEDSLHELGMAPPPPTEESEPTGTPSEETSEVEDPEYEREVICPVTGVFTREFFDRQFPKAFERSRRDRHPLTLVLVRVEGLCDSPGEPGKEIDEKTLLAVADSFRRSVRTRDILARFDDRSFAILMLQIKPTGAFPLTLKIRNDLKKIKGAASEGGAFDLTASFGMNCLLEGDRTSSPKDLLEGCLESLEMASSRGGNQIVLHGVEGEARQ